MDFFQHQDIARRNTKKLIALFAVAVISLVLICNLVAYGVFLYVRNNDSINSIEIAYQQESELTGGILNSGYSWTMFASLSGVVIGIILVASLIKRLQLRSGGRYVAESLGGTLLNPNTVDGKEQVLINVVEEMAIASGMPAPPIYVLQGEQGINAFAAGNTPADAVIGITQGGIDNLTRDELQGVIAHEFSHILNGDMRLNIQLIGVLFGIFFISKIGEFMLRSGGYSRKREGGGLAIAGLVIMVIGWLGLFFGNLIKSAVSREREYLADASAVQFTRNPDGIRDALRVVGGNAYGSEVANENAGEVSHLFFGQALSQIFTVFSTHPPLKERISRIDPQWNGQFIKRYQTQPSLDASTSNRMENTDEQEKNSQKLATLGVVAAQVLGGQEFQLTEDISQVREQLSHLPNSLREAAHEPLGAIATIYGLCISSSEAIKEKQYMLLKNCPFKGLEHEVSSLMETINQMDKTWRLPLIELTLPTLKSLSREQYVDFNKTLMRLMRADQQIDLYEWCLFQLCKHYLAPHFKEEKPSKPLYKSVTDVGPEIQLMLSLFAISCHDNHDEARKAYQRGANTAGIYTLAMLDQDKCLIQDFSKAINKIACCFPLVKPRILKGLVDCAKHDGVITSLEKEMISAIAAVLDCPTPTLEFD